MLGKGVVSTLRRAASSRGPPPPPCLRQLVGSSVQEHHHRCCCGGAASVAIYQSTQSYHRGSKRTAAAAKGRQREKRASGRFDDEQSGQQSSTDARRGNRAPTEARANARANGTPSASVTPHGTPMSPLSPAEAASEATAIQRAVWTSSSLTLLQTWPLLMTRIEALPGSLDGTGRGTPGQPLLWEQVVLSLLQHGHGDAAFAAWQRGATAASPSLTTSAVLPAKTPTLSTQTVLTLSLYTLLVEHKPDAARDLLLLLPPSVSEVTRTSEESVTEHVVRYVRLLCDFTTPSREGKEHGISRKDALQRLVPWLGAGFGREVKRLHKQVTSTTPAAPKESRALEEAATTLGVIPSPATAFLFLLTLVQSKGGEELQEMLRRQLSSWGANAAGAANEDAAFVGRLCRITHALAHAASDVVAATVLSSEGNRNTEAKDTTGGGRDCDAVASSFAQWAATTREALSGVDSPDETEAVLDYVPNMLFTTPAAVLSLTGSIEEVSPPSPHAIPPQGQWRPDLERFQAIVSALFAPCLPTESERSPHRSLCLTLASCLVLATPSPMPAPPTRASAEAHLDALLRSCPLRAQGGGKDSSPLSRHRLHLLAHAPLPLYAFTGATQQHALGARERAAITHFAQALVTQVMGADMELTQASSGPGGSAQEKQDTARPLVTHGLHALSRLSHVFLTSPVPGAPFTEKTRLTVRADAAEDGPCYAPAARHPCVLEAVVDTLTQLQGQRVFLLRQPGGGSSLGEAQRAVARLQLACPEWRDFVHELLLPCASVALRLPDRGVTAPPACLCLPAVTLARLHSLWWLPDCLTLSPSCGEAYEQWLLVRQQQQRQGNALHESSESVEQNTLLCETLADRAARAAEATEGGSHRKARDLLCDWAWILEALDAAATNTDPVPSTDSRQERNADAAMVVCTALTHILQRCRTAHTPHVAAELTDLLQLPVAAALPASSDASAAPSLAVSASVLAHVAFQVQREQARRADGLNVPASMTNFPVTLPHPSAAVRELVREVCLWSPDVFPSLASLRTFCLQTSGHVEPDPPPLGVNQDVPVATMLSLLISEALCPEEGSGTFLAPDATFPAATSTSITTAQSSSYVGKGFKSKADGMSSAASIISLRDGWHRAQRAVKFLEECSADGDMVFAAAMVRSPINLVSIGRTLRACLDGALAKGDATMARKVVQLYSACMRAFIVQGRPAFPGPFGDKSPAHVALENALYAEQIWCRSLAEASGAVPIMNNEQKEAEEKEKRWQWSQTAERNRGRGMVASFALQYMLSLWAWADAATDTTQVRERMRLVTAMLLRTSVPSEPSAPAKRDGRQDQHQTEDDSLYASPEVAALLPKAQREALRLVLVLYLMHYRVSSGLTRGPSSFSPPSAPAAAASRPQDERRTTPRDKASGASSTRRVTTEPRAGHGAPESLEATAHRLLGRLPTRVGAHGRHQTEAYTQQVGQRVELLCRQEAPQLLGRYGQLAQRVVLGFLTMHKALVEGVPQQLPPLLLPSRTSSANRDAPSSASSSGPSRLSHAGTRTLRKAEVNALMDAGDWAAALAAIPRTFTSPLHVVRKSLAACEAAQPHAGVAWQGAIFVWRYAQEQRRHRSSSEDEEKRATGHKTNPSSSSSCAVLGAREVGRLFTVLAHGRRWREALDLYTSGALMGHQQDGYVFSQVAFALRAAGRPDLVVHLWAHWRCLAGDAVAPTPAMVEAFLAAGAVGSQDGAAAAACRLVKEAAQQVSERHTWRDAQAPGSPTAPTGAGNDPKAVLPGAKLPLVWEGKTERLVAMLLTDRWRESWQSALAVAVASGHPALVSVVARHSPVRRGIYEATTAVMREKGTLQNMESHERAALARHVMSAPLSSAAPPEKEEADKDSADRESDKKDASSPEQLRGNQARPRSASRRQRAQRERDSVEQILRDLLGD